MEKSFLSAIECTCTHSRSTSANEVEFTIEKIRSRKLRYIYQTVAKEGGTKIHYEIHKLIISISNKEELPEE